MHTLSQTRPCCVDRHFKIDTLPSRLTQTLTMSKEIKRTDSSTVVELSVAADLQRAHNLVYLFQQTSVKTVNES